MSAPGMTASRCRLPGMAYMITRRTERRVHLFRPDRLMNQVFLYCLGCAAEETHVQLVAATLMSNHYHLVVVDRRGQITKLTERLNGLLTKATQAMRGWQGSVFDGQKPSYTELLTPQALIDKVAYTIANPTAAGLVRFAKDWPGARTRVSDIGRRVVTVERPPAFFAEDGTMPESVELRFEMPETLLEAHGLEGARVRIAEAVEKKENDARAEVEAAGWSFKGADRVRKSSPYARAKTFEARGRLSPRYASGEDPDALDAAIARDAEFLLTYAECRERWLAGERHVVWPAGTDAMRRWHRVPCADPPC